MIQILRKPKVFCLQVTRKRPCETFGLSVELSVQFLRKKTSQFCSVFFSSHSPILQNIKTSYSTEELNILVLYVFTFFGKHLSKKRIRQSKIDCFFCMIEWIIQMLQRLQPLNKFWIFSPAPLVCVGAFDFHYIWSSRCLVNSKITDWFNGWNFSNGRTKSTERYMRAQMSPNWSAYNWNVPRVGPVLHDSKNSLDDQ